jgi:hypothetical protein
VKSSDSFASLGDVSLGLTLVALSMTLWAADASAAGAGVARDTPVASASIQSEIEELRAEIDALRHDHERRWIDETRRNEIRAVVADVIADAGSRTSFAEGDFTAGWNKGFKLVSPDGAFSLKLSGEMQLWYVVNHRRGDLDLPRNPPGTVWGAENRRTRLRFSGHVGDPSIQYLVQATIPPVVGPFLLEFGSIRFVLSPEIDVEVGQFRPQFLREWNVPVFNQLAVDRSVVAAYFSPGFAQGVQLSWKTDRLKLVGWFGDGIGARALGPARTNSMNTPWHRTPTRWAFTGRAEWKPMGEWAQFNDFTSPPDSPTGLLVGVDVMGQEVGAEIPFAEGTVVLGSSADVSLELGGASMMVSGVWQHQESRESSARNPWGLTAQVGVYVAPDVEVFGRYAILDYDSAIDVAPRTARYNGFTVGWNWFANPQVKLTMDWGMNFASLGSGEFVSTAIGYRVDEPGQGHQWAWRTQLQLLF